MEVAPPLPPLVLMRVEKARKASNKLTVACVAAWPSLRGKGLFKVRP